MSLAANVNLVLGVEEFKEFLSDIDFTEVSKEALEQVAHSLNYLLNEMDSALYQKTREEELTGRDWAQSSIRRYLFEFLKAEFRLHLSLDKGEEDPKLEIAYLTRKAELEDVLRKHKKTLEEIENAL